jgi:hypothetical protein
MGDPDAMEINLNTEERLYSSPVSEVFAAALETVLALGDSDVDVDVVEHSIVFVATNPNKERQEFKVSVAVGKRGHP